VGALTEIEYRQTDIVELKGGFMRSEKEIREEAQRNLEGVPHFTVADSDVYDALQWVLGGERCEANSSAVLADVLSDIQQKYQSITGHALVETRWLEEVLSKYFS